MPLEPQQLFLLQTRGLLVQMDCQTVPLFSTLSATGRRASQTPPRWGQGSGEGREPKVTFTNMKSSADVFKVFGKEVSMTLIAAPRPKKDVARSILPTDNSDLPELAQLFRDLLSSEGPVMWAKSAVPSQLRPLCR